MEQQHPSTELVLAVGRLEGKMDAILSLQETQKEHEKRIKSLETSRTWIVGVFAPITLVLGWIAPSYFGK